MNDSGSGLFVRAANMPVTGNRKRAAERLSICLEAHPLMACDEALIGETLPRTELLQLGLEDVLIEQGRSDFDLYLLFSGSVDVIVNGVVVACRGAGEVVGEVEVISPALQRIATIQARETTLVGRISEPAVTELAREFPFLWRSLGRIAVHRLCGVDSIAKVGSGPQRASRRA